MNSIATTESLTSVLVEEPLALLTEQAVTQLYFETLIVETGPERVNFDDKARLALVRKFLTKIRSESGEHPKLTPDQDATLGLIFNPTANLKRSVLRRLIHEVGFDQRETLLKLLDLQLDGATFEKYLSEKINPRTGKPFITIQKRKRRSDTFDSLLQGQTLAGDSTATGDALLKDQTAEDPKPTSKESDDLSN